MMALVGQEQPAAADPAAVGEAAIVVGCATAMRRLLEAGTALVVWQRGLDDAVREELAQLVMDEVDDVLLTSPIHLLDERLAQAMDEAGYPALPRLRDDIALLARRHAEVIDEAEVSIRLEVVETDACRRFHTDYVTARTITTYLGQGTQWIESRHTEAAGLPDGPPIRQLHAGSVAMFKGRIWQEAPAILHRSPPIAGSGEQRLVLVVDPAPKDDAALVYIGATSL
ncbi:DUF1826 domain-containing protein [Sphingomonas koreensis]